MRVVHSVPQKRCYSRANLFLVVLTNLFFTAVSFAQTDVVQTITVVRAPVAGAPPVQESFIVTTTPSPAAVVILLAGATGDIQLTPDGLGSGTLNVTSANPLIRSRWLFAGHDLYAIS